MNKNVIILFVIIAIIAVISILNLHKETENRETIHSSALPANGLVTEPQKSDAPADVMVLTPTTPATLTNGQAVATPAAPASGADDVPASAEVAPAPVAAPALNSDIGANPAQIAPAPATSPTTPATNPAGMAVPASEGQ